MQDQINPIPYRAKGVTESERKLKQLADHSFLTFWSYSSVFIDRGRNVTHKEGKELCDVLVVFQDHILIFSDKDCVFPDTGNLDVDWSRWYKKAIEKSADQIWGAERWIKTFPDKLYLDRACTKPFPIPLPNPTKAKIHRIVVAHGAAERGKAELGGSGSLMIYPDIIGDAHKNSRSEGGRPFAIGQINPQKGYIHIFDDTSLDIVLKKLDTITDFVNYLQKKEKFVLSNQFGGAAGEEELLGFYVKLVNSEEEHDFVVPYGQRIYLEKGIWESFLKSPQAKAQTEADLISYAWDHIITTFIRHIEAGTLYHTSHPNEGLAHYNKQLGFLASLSRFYRRIFAKYLADFLTIPIPPNQNTNIRTFYSKTIGGPYYVFLAMQKSSSVADDNYRRTRRNALDFYCKLTKQRFPDVQDIVGYATVPGLFNETRSDDLIYLDAKEWKPEDDPTWNEIKQKMIVPSLDKLPEFQVHEDEYPAPTTMRINVGDNFFDFQRPGLNQTTVAIEKESNKKPGKKAKPKLKIKLQKKKPAPRTARKRHK